MTDFTAFQRAEFPSGADVAALLASYVRKRRSARNARIAVRLGLAGLASAIVAAAICAALPNRNLAPAPAFYARQAAPAVADIDVAQTWAHDNALIFAETDPGLRMAHAL